jgi:ATP-dependent Clp protease, protease subunit
MKNHGHTSFRPPLFTGYEESYVKLSKHRIIWVSEDVTHEMASELSALLFYYDNEDHEAPIELYINSHGGAVDGLFNIYDVMRMIQAPVRTICIGRCYSAGAVLLAAGTKGERCAFKNSRVMIHGIQCMFPIPGLDVTNSKNYHQFLVENNENIMKLLSENTGQPVEKIRKDCLEDVWFNAQQALDYGIIDQILP